MSAHPWHLPTNRLAGLKTQWDWVKASKSLYAASSRSFSLYAAKEGKKYYWAVRVSGEPGRFPYIMERGSTTTLLRAKLLAELSAEAYVNDLNNQLKGDNRWAAISTSMSRSATKTASGSRSTHRSSHATPAKARS